MLVNVSPYFEIFSALLVGRLCEVVGKAQGDNFIFSPPG